MSNEGCHITFISDPSRQTLPNPEFAELMAAVLAKGTLFRFQASGSSMAPFIRGGDVLTFAPITKPPGLGEIAAFRQPVTGRLMVHRIIRRRQGLFLIKGDNSCHHDGWVPSENILGRVSRIEHRERTVRLGLGWERIPIAALSRLGLLWPLSQAMRRLLRPVY
ncbi:MAG TPA: S24/S26 family peptidase, partial [bacterium]|nr:S24/S26 family peptidase [bacterium]